MSWQSESAPDPVHVSPKGWVLIGLRGGAVIPVLVLTFILMVAIRPVESIFSGTRRPLSSRVPKFASRVVLRLMGFRYKVSGVAMRNPGAVVANHSSWLDIFVVNAAKRVFFVSKAEVAGWAGIGALAKASGTIFIERERAQARDQAVLFEKHLISGHKLMFFPEGTSTDGCRVLKFKSSLFAPFMRDELRDHLYIQPMSVIYHAPKGEPDRFYGWWGEMDFGENMLKILSQPKQGTIEVLLHPPLLAADFADRKALTAACEQAVRDGFEAQKTLGAV